MHQLYGFGLFVTVMVGLAVAAPRNGWEAVLEKGWKPPANFYQYGYSEFTPAYYQGVRAYQTYLEMPEKIKASEAFREFYDPAQPRHYQVSLYEELVHLQPGFRYVATHLLTDIEQLNQGETPGGNKLKGLSREPNPYFPDDIPRFKDATVVSLLPLVMSRIQEDLGRRHPWTIYGGSELNPEEVFWKHSIGGNPHPFFCHLLRKALEKNAKPNCDLKKLGLRIFTRHSEWVPEALQPLLLNFAKDDAKADAMPDLAYTEVLLTFEPFGGKAAEKIEGARFWPKALRDAYGKGKFDVVPHPATMIFFESPFFNQLAQATKNPEVLQLPLAQEISNFSHGLAAIDAYGLRALDISRRRHRFSKTTKSVKNSLIGSRAITSVADEDGPFKEIFVPDPTTMGLYGKPFAKNVQLWARVGPLAESHLFFHGPTADETEINRVRDLVYGDKGKSHVHYRNYYPPMQVNGLDARWYRPLVAWKKPGQDVALDFSLLGSVGLSAAKQPASVWLRVVNQERDLDSELAKIEEPKGTEPETTALNVKKILEFQRLLGAETLTGDLASALINPTSESQTQYADWRANLPEKIAAHLATIVTAEKRTPTLEPLTFEATLKPEFDRSIWRKLVELTEGPIPDIKGTPFVQKNNCDCAGTDADPKGRDKEHCKANQQPDVLTYLRNYYEGLGIKNIHSQKFKWQVPIQVPWWEGLGEEQENLIVVIPGSDHGKAVILADHYDTAYRQDHYDGKIYDHVEAKDQDVPELAGHRHAAKGADDNHSGTVALMEAAVALKDRKLKYDVILAHITGEEFPADGLGTRKMIQALVEGTPITAAAKNPEIIGVYQLDMIGHHTDRDKNADARAVFQIAPGRGERAAKLAEIAHQVTETRNRKLVSDNWNIQPGRNKRWHRWKIKLGTEIEKIMVPPLSSYLPFQDEIRPGWHFRSSLFNTDGQQYSDGGLPVVLFMENYDIGRRGYHDTLDDLENIDLDYARDLTAIVIETVAQAANGRI